MWLKGNLHTHTNLTDGDSPPEAVARWYDDHGYDFLVISDHNVRFDPTDLQAELQGEGRKLLLIPGEELSTWWSAPGRTLALHVNGYGTSKVLGPAAGETVVSVLQRMVDAVVADRGLASINHPNFWESVHWFHIAELRHLTFLEVFNGHHLAANEGTTTQPPMEQVWDLVLGHGRAVWGLAVDDAHDFRVFGPDHANPGRGWVSVESTERSSAALLEALGQGRFYFSTGPILVRAEFNRGTLTVAADRPALIEFVADGALVESVKGEEASVSLAKWRYLRARVESDEGVAWTQPIFASAL